MKIEEKENKKQKINKEMKNGTKEKQEVRREKIEIEKESKR